MVLSQTRAQGLLLAEQNARSRPSRLQSTLSSLARNRVAALSAIVLILIIVSALTAHSACVVQVMHMITHHDSGFRATDYARRLDPCTRAV